MLSLCINNVLEDIRVIKEERSVFWEVIVRVVVRKSSHEHV